MRTDLFDYELPEELIALRPPQQRDGGRLCILGEHKLTHGLVADLAAQIRSGDLVVLNCTKVRKARLLCRRPKVGPGGGAKVELLFLHPAEAGLWAVLGKANRQLREGDELHAGQARLVIVKRGEAGTLLVRTDFDVDDTLERQGEMPIPPYMQRTSDEHDVERYQTVFSEQLGSAAAPTAGLHLTTEMLAQFEARGAELGRVVLHVGLGTFRPVSVADLDEHPMHSEWIFVDETLARQVRQTRERGGRVIAIGTTAVRALESARDPFNRGHVLPTKCATNLLIQPGYQFSVVDALLTNFHQPRSTLLALVSAFAGYERVRRAYAEAVKQRYRFLSYGDAMWIPRTWEEKNDAS